MNDPFASPTSGVGIAEFKDRLILFTPNEYHPRIMTKYGDSDAVDTDMVILDGPDAPQEIDNRRIFQGVLVGSLKGRIGKNPNMVLGRIGTRPNGKDPNGKPVWILNPPTDEDKQVARAYLESKKTDPFA